MVEFGEQLEVPQQKSERPEGRVRMMARSVLGIAMEDGSTQMADNQGIVGGAGLNQAEWLRLADSGEVDPSLLPSDVSLRTTVERGGSGA